MTPFNLVLGKLIAYSSVTATLMLKAVFVSDLSTFGWWRTQRSWQTGLFRVRELAVEGCLFCLL